MDKAIQQLLKENQLTHWKLVSKNSNEWWIRKDGLEFTYTNCQTSWIDYLKAMDASYPLKENVNPKVEIKSWYCQKHGNFSIDNPCPCVGAWLHSK